MDQFTRLKEEQFYATRRFNEPVADPIGLAPHSVVLTPDAVQ
jgi:hypothetical protein